MPEGYKPPYIYTFEEWNGKMQDVLDREGGISLEEVLEEFRGEYRDSKEAGWKGKRFFYGLWRMQEMLHVHPEAFGVLYSAGQTGMISAHVIYAFYQMFAGLPDNMVEQAPPLEMAVQLAQQSHRKELEQKRGFAAE